MDGQDERDLGIGEIGEIMKIFAGSGLRELRIEIGGTRLYLSKNEGGGVSSDAPPPSLVRTQAAVEATAPPVGTESSTAPKAPAAPTTPSAPSIVAESATPASGLHELRSPVLGVFYRRPAPGEPPFTEVGAEVGAGDAVCVVDVMKMFTRVVAGVSGRIVEICAEDGALVEHGQVLMRIEPR